MTDQRTLLFPCLVNSLRPRLNRRPFADDIFKCIFLIENEWILPRISLKFVPRVRINNIPALVQIMAWRRPGDKPLSELMMVSLVTHMCVTRPQWVNSLVPRRCPWLWFYMMTSSNGNIVRVTGPGEFPAQRPVTRSFGVFFDLRPNKRLSKQSRGWWEERPSHPLWRHHNEKCDLRTHDTNS